MSSKEKPKPQKRTCRECQQQKRLNQSGLCPDCTKPKDDQLPLFIRREAARVLTAVAERIKRDDNGRQQPKIFVAYCQ
jgi:uncharacterized paraquat-inducible protein A